MLGGPIRSVSGLKSPMRVPAAPRVSALPKKTPRIKGNTIGMGGGIRTPRASQSAAVY